jgi:Transposase zinc-ribbon domain
MFRAIRWTATDGEPVCPRCGCVAVYEYASRPIFKCKGCGHQFSVTSGTIFASRKLPMRDYLMAIAIFVNGAKGHSALQLSRDLPDRHLITQGSCAASPLKPTATPPFAPAPPRLSPAPRRAGRACSRPCFLHRSDGGIRGIG